MNKTQARKVANSGITVGQIRAMLQKAYDAGAANDNQSSVNKGCTKAVVFNILWKGYKNNAADDVIEGIEVLGATNAIREFGEFGEWAAQPQRKRAPVGAPFHEEAIDIYA